MEERIEGKINDVIEHLLEKPESEFTYENYLTLAGELKDIRFRKREQEQGDRMARMLAATFPGVAGVR